MESIEQTTEERKLTTDEMQKEYVVHSFCAPFVVVTRKSDNVRGTLYFSHMPRFYWDFVPEAKTK